MTHLCFQEYNLYNLLPPLLTQTNTFWNAVGEVVKGTRKVIILYKYFRYLKDFFISMIDFPWSWTLFGFAASFLVSWLIFALVWYCLILYNGKYIQGVISVQCVLCVLAYLHPHLVLPKTIQW